MKIKTFFSDWQDVGSDIDKVVKLYKKIFLTGLAETKLENRKEMFSRHFKDVDFDTVDKLAHLGDEKQKICFDEFQKYQETKSTENGNAKIENQQSKNKSSGISFEPDTSETRKKLQVLARYQQIEKLEKDILVDMQICEIEGWNKTEYLKQLENLICSFTKKLKKN